MLSLRWPSLVYYISIITLVFLVYLISVIPSSENDDTKDKSNGGMARELLLAERTDSQVRKFDHDSQDKYRRQFREGTFKMKPRVLSEADLGKYERNFDDTDVIESHNNVESEKKTFMSRDDFQEDYMGFINHATELDLQDPLLNKHKYEFLVENEYACNGDVFLLVLIHSAANKYKERAEIRKTWGTVRDINGAYIVPIFLLARPSASSGNATLPNVLKESRIYRDIVMADFVDSYKNLTYKNVMGLHWTVTYCNHTKFVLKTDDDTMVDMYHLVRFLIQKSPDGVTENFMYCSTFRNQGPVRIPSDKWFVTLKEYPFTKYPPYCEGFAYVMSMDVVSKLYVASKFVPFYWVDDVYVTGFLAAKAGLYQHDMEYGHSYNLMQLEHLSKHVQSSIFLLAKYSELRKNWDRAWNDILAINRITS